MSGALFVTQSIHGTTRLIECPFKSGLWGLSLSNWRLGGCQTECCESLTKKSGEIRLLRVLAKSLEDYMSRSGLKKILSGAHEQSGIFAAASRASNVPFQCTRQGRTRQRVQIRRMKFAFWRKNEAFASECFNRIGDCVLTDKVRRPRTETTFTSNQRDQVCNKHLRVVGGLLQSPTQCSAHPLGLADNLSLRLGVTPRESSPADLKFDIGMTWFARFCLRIVH